MYPDPMNKVSEIFLSIEMVLSEAVTSMNQRYACHDFGEEGSRERSSADYLNFQLTAENQFTSRF